MLMQEVSLLCSLTLLLDPCSPFPAPQICLLLAISNFDLCYLARILWGVSGVVIEGDGVNITDWHFSVIPHHRRHIQCCWNRWLVFPCSPFLFTQPGKGLTTFFQNDFFQIKLNYWDSDWLFIHKLIKHAHLEHQWIVYKQLCQMNNFSLIQFSVWPTKQLTG